MPSCARHYCHGPALFRFGCPPNFEGVGEEAQEEEIKKEDDKEVWPVSSPVPHELCVRLCFVERFAWTIVVDRGADCWWCEDVVAWSSQDNEWAVMPDDVTPNRMERPIM